MKEVNIKSSTVEKGLELATDFLKNLVGKPAQEIGELMSDRVKLWRLKNQIRNLERVKQICHKEGIPVQKVNMKVLVPYLEGVSLEEDEDLQELWANLLANYIDKEKNLITHVYPSILAQLSTQEIKLLEHFVTSFNLPVKNKKTHETWKKSVKEIELRNLIRLGLIEPKLNLWVPISSKLDTEQERYPRVFQNAPDSYALTNFGEDFYYACTRKSRQKKKK